MNYTMCIYIKYLVFIGLLSLSSCKSMKITELEAFQSNEEKFDHLSLVLDENSLMRAYSTTIRDQRIQDSKVLIERELYANISNEKKDVVGHIKYEIPIATKKINSLPLIGSIILDGVPIVIGVPLVYYRTDVEMQVSIYDINSNLIWKNTAVGTGIEKAQLYKYNRYDARRLANIYAVKEALLGLRQKILVDFNEIESKLKGL